MSPLRTLVVDDEPLARQRLTRMLGEFPAVELVGEAENGREAVERIRELRPELVFLDVQMPGWDGFRVLEELESPPYVVFATAFDAYAIRAFELSAVDYLLKPFDHRRLAAAVAKALDVASRRDVAARLDALARALAEQTPRPLRHLGVRTGDRILLVQPEQVFFFEARAKETSAFTKDREHVVDRSLKQLEAELDPRIFFRCHRSYILNLDRVVEVFAWFGGGLLARLSDGRKVPVSRRQAPELKARLRL
ncbi:MAG: LytR/AlgR family response regulator transcription factor [Gemmatimonadota bacterium]